MKKIIIFTILILSITILYNSCIDFRVIPIKERNSTYYVFDTPLNELRAKIINDFTVNRSLDIKDFTSIQEISVKLWDICTISDYQKFQRSRTVFDKKENSLDLFLYSNTTPFVSYSKVYKKFWKSLKYKAEFQLHFLYIDENKTKIEVITHNSEVLYWSFDLFNTGHSFVNYKKVEPTTIEEYEILLRIGKLVGEKDMPPLKVPK